MTAHGAHLENLVFTDLNAWRATTERSPEILYWRTAGGQEVDFVVETADRLLPVEVKATGSPDPSDARHLRTFLEEYPDLTDGALLLHGGEEVSSGSPRGSWPPRGGA